MTLWCGIRWRLYTLRWLLPPRRGTQFGRRWVRRFVGVVGLWLGQHWCDLCGWQGWRVRPVGDGVLTLCRFCEKH